jgi:hypothetical protein
MLPGSLKVPLIFCDSDEFANYRVARPSLAQRGPGQFGGNAALQKRADVGIGHDRFDRRPTMMRNAKNGIATGGS